MQSGLEEEDGMANLLSRPLWPCVCRGEDARWCGLQLV